MRLISATTGGGSTDVNQKAADCCSSVICSPYRVSANTTFGAAGCGHFRLQLIQITIIQSSCRTSATDSMQRHIPIFSDGKRTNNQSNAHQSAFRRIAFHHIPRSAAHIHYTWNNFLIRPVKNALHLHVHATNPCLHWRRGCSSVCLRGGHLRLRCGEQTPHTDPKHIRSTCRMPSNMQLTQHTARSTRTQTRFYAGDPHC